MIKIYRYGLVSRRVRSEKWYDKSVGEVDITIAEPGFLQMVRLITLLVQDYSQIF